MAEAAPDHPAEGGGVEIALEDPRWRALDIAALARRAAAATLAELGLDPAAHEISVLACDDARIATLNAEFRGKALPTNVLSWPAWDLAAETDGAAPDLPAPDLPGEPAALGDIALAWETCAREAAEQDKELSAHVLHLLVHGCLHLLGYDHIRQKDADLMEGLEVRILASLGVADPY
jgi:probable rRNA maturation factor